MKNTKHYEMELKIWKQSLLAKMDKVIALIMLIQNPNNDATLSELMQTGVIAINVDNQLISFLKDKKISMDEDSRLVFKQGKYTLKMPIGNIFNCKKDLEKMSTSLGCPSVRNTRGGKLPTFESGLYEPQTKEEAFDEYHNAMEMGKSVQGQTGKLAENLKKMFDFYANYYINWDAIQQRNKEFEESLAAYTYYQEAS